MEREIFDLQRKSRIEFQSFKNKQTYKQIDVNYDMMEEEIKNVHKRMRI